MEGNTLWPRPGPNGSPRPAILLTTCAFHSLPHNRCFAGCVVGSHPSPLILRLTRCALPPPTDGCPRVGDRRFGAAFSTPPPGGGAPPDALRVVHAADIVPRVPLSAGPLRVGYA